MKIFLVYMVLNSPQNTEYNYGVGYISSVLQREGHEVCYFSLKYKHDVSLLLKRVREDKPSIIGFSVVTSQFVYIKEIVEAIRNIHAPFLVCGGPHPTLMPDCLLEISSLDAIVRGEGELAMLEFVRGFDKNNNYFNMRNFWFKNKGIIIKNDLRPLFRNLDELPSPDKHTLDYQRIILANKKTNRFIFSRGCVFKCTYCSNKALSELYGDVYFRFMSPQKAINEIERDSKRFHFDKIIFDDDAFSLNKQWCCDFLALYKKYFRYPFQCNLRPEYVDEEIVGMIKDAGAEKVTIGVEHGNEQFRKEILKRKMSNNQIINAFDLCRKYGLEYQAQLMLGLPYENRKLFFDTVELARKISLKHSNPISIFYPYPGTELGKLCENNKWIPSRKVCREREEAILSFPQFKSREIQFCYDVFPLLLRFRFITSFSPMFLLLLCPYRWLRKKWEKIRGTPCNLFIF